MARSDYLFTSESVSEGHPDKVADRISDEVVDLFFREGPKEGMSPWDIRAACETLCTTNRVVIAGETRGPKRVGAGDVEDVARAPRSRPSAMSRTAFIGATPRSKCCCTPSPPISPRASMPAATRMKARATRASCSAMPAARPGLMPAPLYYSHKILKLLADARHSGKEPSLLPDAKSQVTLRYANGKPVEATQIVLFHPARP